jgi:glycosyltransferase involved in cell wall biosynthesis
VRENVRQIEDYLHTGDIGLFTSESEGFCLSILEAMCFAWPRIASQIILPRYLGDALDLGEGSSQIINAANPFCGSYGPIRFSSAS